MVQKEPIPWLSSSSNDLLKQKNIPRPSPRKSFLIFFLKTNNELAPLAFYIQVEVLCVLVWCPVCFVDVDFFIADPMYRVGNSKNSDCSLCSTAWSQWFGELDGRTSSKLVPVRFAGIYPWKTAARFGYVKELDCCKVWLRRVRLLQGLIWIPERHVAMFGYLKNCC